MSTTPATKTLTELEEHELQGKVKMVTERWFKASRKKHDVVKGKADTAYNKNKKIFWFDESGHLTKNEQCNDGNTRNVYYYNDKKLLSSIECHYLLSPEGSYKTYHIYNEDNLEIESGAANLEGVKQWTSITTYNADKTIHTREQINEQLPLFTDLTEYFYHPKSNLCIEWKTTRKNGEIYMWQKSLVTKQGLVCGHQTLDADGNIKETRDWSECFDAEGFPIPTTNTRAITKTEADTYQYRYDVFGNWILKLHLHDNVPVNIIEREIEYYPDAEKLTTPKPSTMKELIIEKSPQLTTNNNDMKPNTEYTDTQLQILFDGMINDTFPTPRYYALKFGEIPSVMSFANHRYELSLILEEFEKEFDAEIIHVNRHETEDEPELYTRYVIAFPDKPYLLSAYQIYKRDSEEYTIPKYWMDYERFSFGTITTGMLQLYYPSPNSAKHDKDFVEELFEVINKFELNQKPEKPFIHMVKVANGGFSLEAHPVKDEFSIKNLDTHYGYKFTQFHQELMNRFKSQTKGLILFHGEPGTGKTYYIRHLLKQMAESRKIVIYMPPNMVDHLVDPTFMTFIAREVADYSAEGQFCVLLIEDAEPLLAARQSETRIQGVTNLLNMTDGLLNDMLSLQIICTFNVPLKKLDKALLRPGRLIARKEFKSLSALDANILAQQLGIKHHFEKPATLSEIYSKLSNNNTLIHDVDEMGKDEAE